MGMQYYFDVGLAERYSVDEAIFVHNIAYWCWKNECNGKNIHEGTAWTYNTTAALVKLFPFWTKSQIERIIKKCVEHGLLLVCINNQKAMDRTRSFAITEIVKCIYRNREMDFSESGKPFNENEKCYKETNNKPNSNTDSTEPFAVLPQALKPKLIKFIGDNQELADAFDGFLQMRQGKKKPIKTDRALTLTLNRLTEYSGGDKHVMAQMLDNSTEACWDKVYPLKDTAVPATDSTVIVDRGEDEW
ncbi:MAG: hypothetical protein LUE11_05320 [Clostridia bacterium]|nr:hypothetical protein [Clostridia bacterium]